MSTKHRKEITVSEDIEVLDKRSCYGCGKEVAHINDGGTAWIAYEDRRGTVFYCNNEKCSANIMHCCDGIDVMDGSHCPNCKKVAEAPTNSRLLINLVKARRELGRAKEFGMSRDANRRELRLMAEAAEACDRAQEAYEDGVQAELDKLSEEERKLACSCGHLAKDHEDFHECGDYYILRKETCPVENRCTPNGGMCEAAGCPCLAMGFPKEATDA